MKKLVDYFYEQFRFHDAILVENSFEHLGFEKPRNYSHTNFPNNKKIIYLINK